VAANGKLLGKKIQKRAGQGKEERVTAKQKRQTIKKQAAIKGFTVAKRDRTEVGRKPKLQFPCGTESAGKKSEKKDVDFRRIRVLDGGRKFFCRLKKNVSCG